MGKEVSGYPDPETGSLQIIYKKYPFGIMTNYLNNQSNEAQINLKGPLGPGLCLKEIRGHYVAYAGGTGLVPFLDLIYYFWENRNDIPDDTSFTLYAAFKTQKEAFAMDLIKATAQILGEKFLLITSIKKKKSRKRMIRIIKRHAAINPELVWICGPTGFNFFIKNQLISAGLDSDKIILM